MAEGTLRVSFGSRSYFLSQNLPVEVRDHNDALVERRHGGFQRSLPEGLYLLRAMLPDGSGHEEVVMVRPDEAVERVLVARATTPHSTGRSVRHDAFASEALRDSASGDDVALSVEVIDRHGCEVAHAEGGSFTFVPQDPRLIDTPFAVLSIGGNRVSTSLPVNPQDRFPGNACVVTAVPSAHGNKLVTEFGAQRYVASAVEGLLRSDRFLSHSDLLDEATGLLQAKYNDPPAAALGALTLHRLGRLGERRMWVENLARDFPWLPDGRVLLASMLCRDERPKERSRGLQALLEAGRHRMMFTDGLSLLLDLLRRWPDGQEEPARGEALADVLPGLAGVDWDATFLTVYADESS